MNRSSLKNKDILRDKDILHKNYTCIIALVEVYFL